MAEEKGVDLVFTYYSRKDVQEAIYNFCKNREAVPRYREETFGKRPDSFQYPLDIFQQIKKGAISFHCSEEIWSDPLRLSTSLTENQIKELREGWDLLIDIDSKYLDYSKIEAKLLIEALKFHNIKNFGIKFSGSKGFHIIIPWKAFPKQLAGKKTKEMFPEWPRIIVSYLKELTHKRLIESISDLSIKDRKTYVKDEKEAEKVIPDLVLVSPRHLFRAPYSLHEKGLVSVVLDEKEIESFEPKLANPLRITIKNFYPEAEENEARELLISALDWFKSRKEEKREKTNFEEVKIDKRKIVLAPSIDEILKGMADGKKRALFILLNYFKCLGFDFEEIEKIISEWNKKNPVKLSENYIASQLSWHKRQKKVLPPNYDKESYYKGIGIFPTQEEIRYKNPVNYTLKKSRR